MRLGTSRADRLGFIVFIALAALLAVLLLTDRSSTGDDVAQDLSTEGESIASLASLPQPTDVPTTEPIAVPDPTPTATPVPPTATAVPATPTPTAEASEASTGTTDSGGSTTTTTTSNAAPAPAQQEERADVSPQPSQPLEDGQANPQPSEPLPTSQAASPQAATPQGPAPQPSGGGTFTYTATSKVARPTLYSSPGGPAFTPTFNGTPLPAISPTVFGNPLVYRVRSGSPDDDSPWIEVYVPARPNSTTAFVLESEFTWGSSNRMIEINVSNNTVTVYEGSNVLLTTGAVTGKSSSRTPLTVTAWVEERLDGSGPNQGFIRPGGPYGTYALSLGVFSNDLNSFGGSIPKIALHGTNNPALIGQYASNGCIRVRTEVIHQIAGLVPLGSKVQLVA